MTGHSYNSIIRRCIPDVEFHQNSYANILATLVGPTIRWLDIGAGAQVHNGYGVPSSTELASQCAELVGLDFEEHHLKSNADLTGYVVGSAERIPFGDDRFDLVTANMVLEHLGNPSAVFREIARCLAPGGCFAFVTPNLNHPIVRLVSVVLSPQTQRALTHRLEGRATEHIFPTFYRANTVRRISRLAADAGLACDPVRVLRNIPFLTKPAIGTWIECQGIRLMKYRLFQGLGADIVGILRKPATK